MGARIHRLCLDPDGFPACEHLLGTSAAFSRQKEGFCCETLLGEALGCGVGGCSRWDPEFPCPLAPSSPEEELQAWMVVVWSSSGSGAPHVLPCCARFPWDAGSACCHQGDTRMQQHLPQIASPSGIASKTQDMCCVEMRKNIPFSLLSSCLAVLLDTT